MILRAIAVLMLGAFSAQAVLTPEQRAKLPPPATQTVDFKRDIQPIVENSCVKCHGKGRDKGGFVFETRDSVLKGGDSGPAIIVGNSAESLLIELVSGLDPDNVMPEKGTKLTDREVSLMRAWIDQGAKWDQEITFAKKAPLNLHPRTPEVPPGKGAPVDRLLSSYFKQRKVKLASLVDDRTFARRAYLDVIGLLPTPEEQTKFEKRKGEDKRRDLVRELLARKNDYAQHWMSFWNDALRNDYRGTGYIDGGRKQITGWLYTALAENKPFDQFARELINPTPQSEGFVKGIVWRGVVNASQTSEMQAAQNISQVFMGVNLKCASCHDSFIDDWTLADAYGLASIYSEKPLELVQCDKPLGKNALVKFLYPELGEIDASAPKTERIKRLAEIVGSPQDGRLSRTIVNRLWARFFGHGLVEPVDEMEKPAWSQDLLDWLAADLVANKYDLKRTIELMLTSRAYQMPSVALAEEKEGEFVFRGPVVRRMSAEQFLDALGSITGVWNGDAIPDIKFAAGETKLDATLESAPGKPRWIWSHADAASRAKAETIYFHREIELPGHITEARGVLTCDNAFTLMINGKKAGSSKDYTRPTSVDLRKHLKPGVNKIVISATNDPGNPGAKDADQSNPAGLIALFRVRTKDDVLDFGTDSRWTWSAAANESGTQNAAELGNANAGPWAFGARLAGIVANQEIAADCRAVLANADPLMVALGRPNREQVITTRPSIATTLQALELTNGRALADRIRAGAENLSSGKSLDVVARVYTAGLGRSPTSKEREIARELVGAQTRAEGVEDLLWVVCMLPEFQLIR